MQSVSDDDVWKRLLEKPRFELAAKGVFRLGRCYIFRQGVPGLWASNWERSATDGWSLDRWHGKTIRACRTKRPSTGKAAYWHEWCHWPMTISLIGLDCTWHHLLAASSSSSFVIADNVLVWLWFMVINWTDHWNLSVKWWFYVSCIRPQCTWRHLLAASSSSSFVIADNVLVSLWFMVINWTDHWNLVFLYQAAMYMMSSTSSVIIDYVHVCLITMNYILTVIKWCFGYPFCVHHQIRFVWESKGRANAKELPMMLAESSVRNWSFAVSYYCSIVHETAVQHLPTIAVAFTAVSLCLFDMFLWHCDRYMTAVCCLAMKHHWCRFVMHL